MSRAARIPRSISTSTATAREQTAWAGPTDGLLTIDLAAGGGAGSDGQITLAKEISFGLWTSDPNDSDAQALKTMFDTNHDGKLTAADTRFGEFRLWKDANQNGIAEAGELSTLASLGITQLNLTTDGKAIFLPDGSRIAGFGSFTQNNIVKTYADAALAYDETGFRRVAQSYGFDYVSEDGTTKKFIDTAVLGAHNAATTEVYLNLGGNGGIVADGYFAGTGDDTVYAFNGKAVTIYGDAGNDLIEGDSGNDVLDGGPGQDTLIGGAGDDTLYFDAQDFDPAIGRLIDGKDGYDTAIFTSNVAIAANLIEDHIEAFIANDGNDTLSAAGVAVGSFIDGRGGNDVLTGSAFDDILIGGTGDDTLSGGEGGDLLQGGNGADRLYGQNGDDVLFAGLGNDVLDGGEGVDALHGGAGADWLYGGNGNDLLDGGNGIDTLAGGAGDDIYVIDTADSIVESAGQGLDTIRTALASYTLSAANVENLQGLSETGQILTGNAGVNLVAGGDGNDVLIGLGGNDTLDGGLGIDTASYAAATHAVAVHLEASTPYASSDGVEVGTDILLHIENAWGGIGADYFYGSAGANAFNGNDGNDAFYAGNGNDSVDGGSGDDYVLGEYGNDSLSGGAGGDVIYGGADNDTITGGDGNDVLHGDTGIDALDGGLGDDVLYIDAADTAFTGGAGYDYVVIDQVGMALTLGASALIEAVNGSSGNDGINAAASTGAEYVRAYDGNDTVTGSALNDYLNGGNGVDIVNGGNGDDTLAGDAGADQLFGGAGNDTLYVDHFDTVYNGGAGNDYLIVQDAAATRAVLAGMGIEWATGFTGNDTIDGSNATNAMELHGGDGADWLYAGAVGATLLGENGNDQMYGGAGSDNMVGGAGADTFGTLAHGGSDYIYDFEDRIDKIDLSSAGIHAFG